jgi:ribonuclease D
MSDLTQPDLDVPFEPREGVPAVISGQPQLDEWVDRLAQGHGPIAIDAERASGFKYSQRAYLIQMRRTAAGSALIDPIEVPDLSAIAQVVGDAEWILHAATQDLGCLAEVGLVPRALFDTELAGRLLGKERVSLAALIKSELGETLEKGHGAADWSLRPLTPAQLRYAALDVELLIELRDHMEAELRAADKWQIAVEEFGALLHFRPKQRSEDHWRKVSGLHKIRKPRELALVRSLWQEREARAIARDIAPGRVLPDSAIIAATQANPTSIAELSAIREFSGRGQQRAIDVWWRAIERARELPESELPPTKAPVSGPPQVRSWSERNPPAFERLQNAKDVLTAHSERLNIPLENLLTPETLRRLCWDPPTSPTMENVGTLLRSLGAREWQVSLLATDLAAALLEPQDSPSPEFPAS